MAERRGRSVALVALLAVAGCGGGDDAPEQVSLTGAAPKLEQVRPAGGTDAPAAPKPEKRRAPAEATKKRAAAEPKPGAAGAEMSAAQRVTLVKRIAPAVVGGLGFGQPTITTDGGRVTIAIAPAKACALGLTGPATLRERLAGALPFAKSIALVEQERRRPLGAYVTATCKPPVPPAASGRLVLEADGGPGTTDTKTFRVTSKTWTVTYANSGEFMQALALKGDKVQSPAISATKTGKGKETFKGPGTFKLRITGSGDWSVQVRDGG